MKYVTSSLGFLLAFLPLVLIAQANAAPKPCIPCEHLTALRLPDVKILSAASFKHDTIQNQIISVPFCRVLGRISKEINFELLLPLEWNERFLMSGGGGFVGSIVNLFRERVSDGYATVGTDTGHQGNELTADWALNNMERQINFGRLAVHRTAVVSQSIIASYYCSGAAYSYFLGCSRGGGQAMVEAQIYPEDFDGIVAGAPAINWPAIGAKFIEINQKNYSGDRAINNPILTTENLALLQDLVLKQCDKLDGLKDQIINDPRDCEIDLSSLPICPEGEAGVDCFTRQQFEVIKAVYSPLKTEGQTIYPPFPYGLENEDGSWIPWITGINGPSLQYYFGIDMYKYLVFNDPEWNFRNYDFKNFFEETRYASSFLNATATDYSGLKKRNGKMILYHGWNDPALSAYETIRHYQEAQQKDEKIQAHIRLFLLPGVLHCWGGRGPFEVDWVRVIREWVENGSAPERVVLSKTKNGKVVMSRPIYPYPKVSVYSGKGDANVEKNFTVGEN